MGPSEYIAYFDESGDHGLESVDPDFPVFVLCGCVFKIAQYLAHDLPVFSGIKFTYFGHDAVVFHSRDIRKRVGPFQVLSNTAKREKFMTDIADYYRSATCTIIAAGIHKGRHKAQYVYPDNPYSISLLFCLERLYAFLRGQGEIGHTMYCIFEKRGETEDRQLAKEFERICGGENMWGQLPFRMVFASKQTNMPGLQIADLAAYPIARHIIEPTNPNLAFDALQSKFRRNARGVIRGWGLKVFP